MLQGLMTYIRGVRWLLKRPLTLALLFIPFFLGLLMIAGSFELFGQYEKEIYSYILFTPSDSYFSQGLHYVTKFLLQIGMYALMVLVGFLGANLISSPVYDYVSILVERSVLGRKEEEISLWKSVLLIPEEMKKLVFILFISFLLMIIPGINIISPFVTAFLLGWDFFDYPLARRGLNFKERKSLAFKSKWRILGLGLWLLIPFIQILLLPMAVSGGTMLGLEALQKK